MPQGNQDEVLESLAQDFPKEKLQQVAARTGPGQLPPGQVVLKVRNAYLGRSQMGNRMITIECEVVSHSAGEEYKGATYFIPRVVENEDGWAYFNGMLVNLGFDPVVDIKTQLLPTLDALKGIQFRANLTENQQEGMPPNCWINAGARIEGGRF